MIRVADRVVAKSGIGDRATPLLRALPFLADTLVDEHHLADLPHRLVRHCVHLLGAVGAALSLADRAGVLEAVAASPVNARLRSLLQVGNEQGPSVDAFRTGITVRLDDLEAVSSAWPLFATEALVRGYQAAYCAPLQVHSGVIGVLTVLVSDQGSLRQPVASAVHALAELAAIGVTQERLSSSSGGFTGQTEHVGDGSPLIDRAASELAAAGRIPREEAFSRMIAYSCDRRLSLTEVADVVSRAALALEDVLGDATAS
ncbi:transcriptional regulator [Amycolatopsis sp. A1MSW2902]